MSIIFKAALPPNAETPVKPTTDFNPETNERRVRIWLDAYMKPGDAEKLLLFASERTFKVTIEE